MDGHLFETVATLEALPEDAKRQIALNLLNQGREADLPVIEFNDPALDGHSGNTDTHAA